MLQAQRLAYQSILSQLIAEVRKNKDDLLATNEAVAKCADLLLGLANSHSVVAMTTFNTVIKKALASLLEDTVNDLGSEVIQSFQEMAKGIASQHGRK